MYGSVRSCTVLYGFVRVNRCTGIRKVSLTFDAFPDPNVGYDDIAFCEESSPTPATKPSWVKLESAPRPLAPGARV